MFIDVFQGYDFYTHMPFLLEEAGDKALMFCKSDHSEEDTVRRWKLHYTILEEDLTPYDVTRIETGLGEDYIECNPSAYVNEEGLLIVTFVAGLYKNKETPIRYRTYQMQGYNLDSLSEATNINIEPQLRPWSGCQGFRYNAVAGNYYHLEVPEDFEVKKTIVINDKHEDKKYFLTLDVHNILRVSSLYGDQNKILITCSDPRFSYRYKSFIYDITEDKFCDIVSNVKNDNHYKSSVYGNLLAYADKLKGGFENRAIYIIKDRFSSNEIGFNYERIEK